MTPSLARILLAPVAAAVLAATATGAASAVPGPRADPSAEVARYSAAESPAESLAYWTEERMAAARPIARILEGTVGGLLPRPPADAPAEPGARPDGETRPQSAGATGKRWTGGGKVARTTGRVFLTMGGRDFTCTASVVPSDNGDTVVTAGHCLKDGTGDWASKWVFVPGYDDGKAPYGRFAARELLVTSQWSSRADDSHDFGAAVLETREGRHVRQAAGAQRIAFTGEGAGTVHAFGYPSRSPYDGRHLHYCSGSTRPDDGGTTAYGMSCGMTEGSSGGPWLSGFDPSTGAGTVVSVVSFKYAGRDGMQYGPVLGSSERAVYDRARAL
ncbi:trypsin-like serine peptidase [Nocardiopsis potens]|uniref:trypsin-like serine peptidase n=1 Tax=Nocardiopsis potens TaxID=1246458 RepID=UPI000475E702|nr:trypsin-like serine protease [Nocardiopsis potens]